jgi:hypothetical protein
VNKLSLNLAELKVESFETFVAERDRGTVHANQGCITWSCGGTCGAAPDTTVLKDGVNAMSYRPQACCV